MNIIEKKVELTLCEQPIDYAYDEIPEITSEDYKNRLKMLWDMEQSKDYDSIVIYGDREHFSNIHYFTGYDPRWEESLLFLRRNAKPILLVGNEGIGYSVGLKSDVEIRMFQSFSLMGQPNDERSKQLKEIMKECGISPEKKVGLIGWKAYPKEFFEDNMLLTDVPYYIVATLASITGMPYIENATPLLSDCEYGLKHNVSAKEIVQFEIAGTKISRGIYNSIKNAKPGMREIEMAELIGFNGEPGNMHPNINMGDSHVCVGLNSPKYDVKLEYGIPLGIGYGLRGSLVHKCGMYIRNKEDLPDEKRGYIEEFLKPYFSCVVKWYEMMKIGTTCGDVYDMVEKELGFEKFGIGLNPGHLTHTDEWTNSPFVKESNVKIRSGMAFQCDYTVNVQDPFMSAHIEDGLVIADEKLREEIKVISPTCYKRIVARQNFVRDVLNINISDEVLPLSDLTCVCFPYMADVSIILAKE